MSALSTLEANSLKGALEALLLVSSDPVSAPALAGALGAQPGISPPANACRCWPSSR